MIQSQSTAAFELVLNGFNGDTDETDGLVIWVSDSSLAQLEARLVEADVRRLIGSCTPLPCLPEADIDFRLPGEIEALVAKILEGRLDTDRQSAIEALRREGVVANAQGMFSVPCRDRDPDFPFFVAFDDPVEAIKFLRSHDQDPS